MNNCRQILKRFIIFFLVVALSFTVPWQASACDEKQSNTYMLQILFGDSASKYQSDSKVKMLEDAVYLCSEQYGNLGQTELDYLKQQKVSVPALEDITVKQEQLTEYSHKSWDSTVSSDSKRQNKRKKILQSTVNKVFGFNFFTKFTDKQSSSESAEFAELLYYAHILSDYLSADPEDTAVSLSNAYIDSYSGKDDVTVNGNKPSFTAEEKSITESFVRNSSLDSHGRTGTAFACIGPDSINTDVRENISSIRPAGWNNASYQGITYTSVYNRSHLIAHMLGGSDTVENLFTGTEYLNQNAMKGYEEMVKSEVSLFGYHVLYRVTPIYKNDNKVPSGVQMEAYSVEDRGKTLSFNVYLYNIQPGIRINYATGATEVEDSTVNASGILPFAVSNANENNPDLMFEIQTCLENLLSDDSTKGTNSYINLMNDLKSIAGEARMTAGSADISDVGKYQQLNGFEFEYFNTLKTELPYLLKRLSFFKEAFS